MELTVLGMNGPFPAANGATSGYLMRGEKTRVVMDMGSGTLGRLTALMPPEKLDALLLSHWHFDHCSDVLPLLFRLQACAAKLLELIQEGCKRFALCHLSQENNTPALALQTVFNTLGAAGVVPDRDCIVQAQRRSEVSPALEF